MAKVGEKNLVCAERSLVTPPKAVKTHQLLGLTTNGLEIFVSALRIPSEGAGNWARMFNIHSKRKENHGLGHKTSLFLSFLLVF